MLLAHGWLTGLGAAVVALSGPGCSRPNVTWENDGRVREDLSLADVEAMMGRPSKTSMDTWIQSAEIPGMTPARIC
jgi:hypothetical protein